MIISDTYKLIFDASPKTGSTSVENYFRSLGLSDEEVIHGTIHQDRRKDWVGYTKFTIVRNPYEKAVSWYLYQFKQMRKVYPNALTELRFEDYLTIYGIWKMKESRIVKNNPDTQWIKIEDMSVEVPKIAKKVGLNTENVTFPHLNDTNEFKKKNWREYYVSNENIAEIVYETLKDDFEMFGYDKESYKMI